MNQTHTVEDVAKALKFSVGHVYNMVSQGKIPHRKIGSSVRFTDEDIQTFLDKQKVKANPKAFDGA